MSLIPPAPEQFIEGLRSRIVEGRTLTPSEFRPIAIPLQVTLSNTRTQGTASFVIPSQQRFVFMGLLPHVVPSDVSAAANASGSIPLAGRNRDLLLARAHNCRVNLAMASSTFDLFAQQAFSLGDLFAQYGEDADFADMPGILPQGTSIDLSAALVDTAAAACPDCEYGVVLVGAFVTV